MAGSPPSANTDAMSTTKAQDEAFQLYDIRVEVVCPEGSRILCGARSGDYFTLQGEMLYLPAGQGISLYSLGKSSLKIIMH
jgi:hypothetical protein